MQHIRQALWNLEIIGSLFRASLQKVINEIKEPVDLVTLRDKFIDYWKTHSDPNSDNHLEAYFYRFFPADRAGEAQVEDYRNPSKNNFSKDFEKEFDNRLFWEIYQSLDTMQLLVEL